MRVLALSGIGATIFAVGTLKDHIAPRRSIHRISLFSGTAVTFVLTSGGHNAGIASPPRKDGRHFEMMTRRQDACDLDPEACATVAPCNEGSWRPDWAGWQGPAARAGARQATASRRSVPRPAPLS